jgi:hypothetical protein
MLEAHRRVEAGAARRPDENRKIKQMGASQSQALSVATEELKERVGKFSLRTDQKDFVRGLSVLLSMVLSRNSLYDLEPILTHPQKCHELVVILSSLLRKEFRVLRLPDASTRGATHKVPWMTARQYEQLENEPYRQNVCNDIAWFILRFVTLITALTASVKINEDMPALLQRAASSVGVVNKNKTYKDVKLTPELQTAIRFSSPISKETLNGLLDGKLHHVKVPGTDTYDSRKLYFFEGQDRLAISAQHGYLYFAQKTSTVLLKIELTPAQRSFSSSSSNHSGHHSFSSRFYNRPPRNNRRNASANAAAAALAAAANEEAAEEEVAAEEAAEEEAAETGNNQSSRQSLGALSGTTRIGSQLGGRRRKSRRFRMSGRKTRKQHGGEQRWYKVVLYNLANCKESPCEKVDEFYMNNDGLTVNIETYGSMSSTTLVDNIPLADRVNKYQSKEDFAQVATIEPDEYSSPSFDSFLPLNKVDATTWSNFKMVEKAMNSKAEGTSPAQYRAFLLATSVEKQGAGQPERLHNLFCGDSWAGKRTTDSVSYALLNALYSDRQDGGKEGTTSDELKRTVSEFTSTKALFDFVSYGTFPESFEQTKFPTIPAELDPYCKQVHVGSNVQNSGNRAVVGEYDKEILVDAHKALRDLYDEQLKTVMTILGDVLDKPLERYDAAPELRLSTKFEEAEGGSLVYLEEVIKNARTKLAEHYLAVERVYNGALQSLRANRLGAYASKPKQVVQRN